MRRAFVLAGFVLALALSSCGVGSSAPAETPSGSQSPSPAATPPATPKETLFGAFLNEPRRSEGGFDSVVAVMGLDGSIKAKAAFRPPGFPRMPMAVPMLPAQGVATTSGVYFVDAAGEIRLLTLPGPVEEIATIPFGKSKQEEISFAVSPNEREIIASVITFPETTDANGSDWGSGSATVDVYRAARGGAPRLLRHSEYTKEEFEAADSQLVVIVGWDQIGPIGIVNTDYAVQEPKPARWFGKAVRLTGSGAVGTPLCDKGYALDALPDGTVACQVGARIEVVAPSGAVSWSIPWDQKNYLGDYSSNFAALSPDAGHLCVLQTFNPQTSVVFARDGSKVALGEDIHCRGWVTRDVMLGSTRGSYDDTDMTLLSLDRLSKPEPLPRAGKFAGTIVVASS